MTTQTFFPTDSPPFAFDHFKLLGRVAERIWDDVLGLRPTGRLPFGWGRRPAPTGRRCCSTAGGLVQPRRLTDTLPR